jgi:hypothetical protein
MGAKGFERSWILDEFEGRGVLITRPMFGGLAVYLDGLMVMMICESPGDRRWRGKKYAFDIWDGVLFPTERAHHASLIGAFPYLVPHPVLPKWLFVSVVQEDFEDHCRRLARRIAAGDPRFGVVPKPRKPRRKK